ncbi:hypothetical protein D3C84_1018720 [compost metagenome]
MTAPSWSGVFGVKILTSSSELIRDSIAIPDSMNSLTPVLRSNTINAPIFRFAM